MLTEPGPGKQFSAWELKPLFAEQFSPVLTHRCELIRLGVFIANQAWPFSNDKVPNCPRLSPNHA